MKEFGQLFLGSNEKVPLNAFILSKSDIEIQTGDTVKIENLHPILVTCSVSLADKLFCLGITRSENIKGVDMLLMINPGAEVKL